MSLDIRLSQHVECQDVVDIARQACEAILKVYNGEASLAWASHPAARLVPCSLPAAASRRAQLGVTAIFFLHPLQAESWNVEHKADESPLTRADKDANAVICDGLARIGAAAQAGGNC